MSNKTLAILSYITIIGALIAYINGRKKKDRFFRFHLNQGFGLGLLMNTFICLNQLVFFDLYPNSGFYRIFDGLNLIFLALAVIGIVNVFKHKTKPLPLIGRFFLKTGKFS